MRRLGGTAEATEAEAKVSIGGTSSTTLMDMAMDQSPLVLAVKFIINHLQGQECQMELGDLHWDVVGPHLIIIMTRTYFLYPYVKLELSKVVSIQYVWFGCGGVSQ